MTDGATGIDIKCHPIWIIFVINYQHRQTCLFHSLDRQFVIFSRNYQSNFSINITLFAPFEQCIEQLSTPGNNRRNF